MPPNRLTTAPPVTTSLALKTARNPTPAADIAVPAGQAFIGALAVVVLVGAVGFAAEWAAAVVGKLAALGFAIAFIGALWWRLGEVTETLTERVETFIGQDLNGGGIGISPPHYVTTNQPVPLDANEWKQKHLWQFLAWSYRTHKTSLEAATAAGIVTENQWSDCKRVLDAAGVTEPTRAGDTAGWKLIPATAEACWREVAKGQGGFYLQ